MRFADGGLAVAGFANGSLVGGKMASGNAYLDRRDAFGNVLWAQTFAMAGSASALIALEDQSFVLAGTTLPNGTAGTDAFLLRTDPWGRATCASAGVCGVAPPATCDDGNACTADVCDPAAGACLALPLADGATCGANGQTCSQGVCGG